jgi:hypothetical protein
MSDTQGTDGVESSSQKLPSSATGNGSSREEWPGVEATSDLENLAAPASWPASGKWNEKLKPTGHTNDRAIVLNGCVCGLFLNIVLGYVTLVLQRQGLPVYGPAVVAITVGLGLLLLILKPWSRRTQLLIVSCLGGMILGFCAIWLLIRPLLPTADAPVRSTPTSSISVPPEFETV